MTDKSITIHAPAHLVYDLVADPMRMADWSPECIRCRWIGGARRPAVGARFRGTSRNGRRRWTTTSTITEMRHGVSLEECEALKDWRGSKFFNEPERAALAYVDAMIAAPDVPDDVFNAIRKHYNEREIVELTVLVGTYLMHNRVFTALKVDVEPKKS